MNTAKHIFSHLEEVKEMKDQEISVLKQLLLTDPIKINSAIDILIKRKQKATPETVAKCDDYIQKLYLILEKEVDTTLSIYSLSTTEDIIETTPVQTVEQVKEETTMVHQQPPTVVATENQSVAVLKVVRDDDDLRKKYESMVKKLNMDDLTKHLKSISKTEATEAAHFILSNGLYLAKKQAKKWEADKITRWLDNVVFKEDKPTPVISEESVVPISEKYKKFDHTMNLAEVGYQAALLIGEGKGEEAIEFATYMLSNNKYIDSLTDGLTWNEETIKVYIEQVSAIEKPAIEEAKEVPFWDITASEVWKEMDQYLEVSDITLDAVKAAFVQFLNNHQHQAIEQLSDHLKTMKAEEIWDKYYRNSAEFKINSLKQKRESALFEQNNAELKKVIIQEFMDDYLKGNKEKLESKEIGFADAALTLKSKLIDKGFTTTSIKYSGDVLKDLAYRAAINVKWAKEKKETPSPESTENKTPESVAFVGPEVSVGDKFPEIKDEIAMARYLEDVYVLSKKYIDNEEKSAYTMQLIANSFLDGNIYERAGDTEPIKWNLNQVISWLETDMTKEINTNPAENEEAVNKEVSTEENPVEEIVQPVETETIVPEVTPEIIPVTEPAAEPVVTPMVEPVTEPVTEPTPEKVEVDETEKAIIEANNKDKFQVAIGNFLKNKLTIDDNVKMARSTCLEIIRKAVRNNKKSFARSAYKKSTDGEVFNAINNIAINAGVEGFMNNK